MDVVLKIALAYLLWTFYAYWWHRLAHVHHRRNFLWKLHSAHHAEPYLHRDTKGFSPQVRPDGPGETWRRILFVATFGYWTGSLRPTLDDFLAITLPILSICLVDTLVLGGGECWILFAVGWMYEVWLSEGVLLHNRRLRKVRYFAVGDFHLWHHHGRGIRKNYGLCACALWDYVFGTAELPPDWFLRDIADDP